MYVVSVGYGRQMFNSKNTERKRMERCASELTELHMVIFTLKTDDCEPAEANNLRIYPTNSSSKLLMIFDAVRIISQIVKKNSKDFVVTTQDPFEAGLVGYMIKKRFGTHLTVQEHADVFGHSYWRDESVLNQIRYQLGLFILKRADTIRTVSDRITKKMQSLKLKANLTQLPVAIDTSLFRLPDQEKTHPEHFTFLTVARFVKQKNPTLMLIAFNQVWKQNPEARLVVVGQGPEEPILQSLVTSQYEESDPPVTFIDWTDDVAGLMNQADAYVLSSNYEGWGRVLIESMIMKLPVVTTDVGCAGEVLLDGQHGLVVPVADESALSEAMTKIMTDTTLYQRVKTNLSTLDAQNIKGVDMTNYGKKWAQSLT